MGTTVRLFGLHGVRGRERAYAPISTSCLSFFWVLNLRGMLVCFLDGVWDLSPSFSFCGARPSVLSEAHAVLNPHSYTSSVIARR
jgi:hypothetical protein